MNREIGLNINGGFPFTQDTLAFMQDTYRDILKASYSHLMIDEVGKYIIGGAVDNGINKSDGWLLLDGELLKLTGGVGDYVRIEQVQITVTYGDNNAQSPYTHKWAEITAVASGNILFEDFKRVSRHKKITTSDCTHLANRTHSYSLPKFVTTLELDDAGNTTGGFILNKIEPFEGIPNGYQLMVKCGDGTALTFMTKNSVVSNFLFNRGEYTAEGEVLITPYFSNSKFIGSSNNLLNSGGYAQNLHVLFSWSSYLNKWVEVSRSSGQSI